MLRKGRKHVFGCACGQATAMVFHVNQNAVGEGVSVEGDLGVPVGAPAYGS